MNTSEYYIRTKQVLLVDEILIIRIDPEQYNFLHFCNLNLKPGLAIPWRRKSKTNAAKVTLFRWRKLIHKKPIKTRAT